MLKAKIFLMVVACALGASAMAGSGPAGPVTQGQPPPYRPSGQQPPYRPNAWSMVISAPRT